MVTKIEDFLTLNFVEIVRNSVYKVYIKLNAFNVFKLSYVDLLNKYLKKSANNKLKYIMTLRVAIRFILLSTDTSFIPNKKGKTVTGYNRFYNRKRGTKISLITDSNGITLNMACYKGNIYDSYEYFYKIFISDS